METTRESVAEDIANAITTWETYDWKDDDLWESFQDDFKGYTEDDFRLVNNNDVRRLRKFLRRRGVWIEKSRTTIARSLFNALQEEEPTEWTDADIQEYLLKEGAFDSYRINVRLKKTPITLPPDIVPPTVSPFIPPIIKPTSSLSNVSTNNSPPATSSIPAPITPTDAGPIPTVGSIIIAASSVDPPPAMTTTITGQTPTSPLGPPAAVTLSVPVPFASSSSSPTPRGEAPVSTSSASPTPAPVNASTILPSTTTYVPPPTPPTGTGPAPFGSSSASSAPLAPAPGTGPAPAI